MFLAVKVASVGRAGLLTSLSISCKEAGFPLVMNKLRVLMSLTLSLTWLLTSLLLVITSLMSSLNYMRMDLTRDTFNGIQSSNYECSFSRTEERFSELFKLSNLEVPHK